MRQQIRKVPKIDQEKVFALTSVPGCLIFQNTIFEFFGRDIIRKIRINKPKKERHRKLFFGATCLIIKQI